MPVLVASLEGYRRKPTGNWILIHHGVANRIYHRRAIHVDRLIMLTGAMVSSMLTSVET